MKAMQRFCLATLPLSLLLTTAMPASAAQGILAPTPGTISVTGDAQINVVPDEVIITLGVETSDMVLTAAKADNDQRISKILALAKDADIDPKNIQTDFITIQPRYDGSSRPVFIGYWVRKTVVITLKDISKFDSLLSATVESGANFVQGIQFVTTELRKHRDEARALAIQAAKEKAVALAGQLGQKIGKPLTINEAQNSWYSYYGNGWGSQYSLQSQNVVQNAASSSSSGDSADGTTLAPGQIKVTAQVSVTFELTD